jgi:lysophospholipase L1-like esterase
MVHLSGYVLLNGTRLWQRAVYHYQKRKQPGWLFYTILSMTLQKTALTFLLVPILLQFPLQGETAEVPASITPNPRMLTYPWMSLSTWYEMHAEDVALATEGKAPLVFIGDSITQGWNGAGQSHWEKHFAPLGAVNFGIGGDTTQNLLWRLKYGATENLDPKAVMLLIGTNNFPFTEDEPETIAAGVIAVVDAITESYPNADILLMGVFPRSENPDHPLRAGIKRINGIISQLADRDPVTYLEITNELLESDGTLSKDVMPDFLHLSDEGYRRWTEAILPWITNRVDR